LPSELIETASEILIWALVGLLLLSNFTELGIGTLQVSSDATFSTIGRYIADTVNIVGSRRVEVTIELPRAGLTGLYTVSLSGKSIAVKSRRGSIYCMALYPSVSVVLESGHRYVVRPGEGGVYFMEAGAR